MSVWEAEVGVVACLFADQHAVSSASFCAVQSRVRAAKHLRPGGFARLLHRDADAHCQGYALVALKQNKVRNGYTQQFRNPAGCHERVVREGCGANSQMVGGEAGLLALTRQARPSRSRAQFDL